MIKRNVRVLVPRILDANNFNAQNLNAKAMLSRFTDDHCQWVSTYYNHPALDVQSNPNVSLVKLWRWRLWAWRMFLLYQQSADAVFYPGMESIDHQGLKWRERLRRKVPVIATMEGLVGDQAREDELSKVAGHEVKCHRVPDGAVKRIDAILHDADHVIAISPFLKQMGEHLYGDKFSIIPLGIDGSVFHARHRKQQERFTVVCAGTVYPRKRPELFIDLAEAYPEADFVWYGDGPIKNALQDEIESRNIHNLSFPGGLTSSELAERFRSADLFVLPAHSEGVPKVAQEAAACGLPVILFGFYEAPTLVDGVNGYVIWDDRILFQRAGELINNPDRAMGMGEKSAQMAFEWDWNVVAPKWEAEILKIVKYSMLT